MFSLIKKVNTHYVRRITESTIAVNFKHLTSFFLRWKDVEKAAAMIYHYCSLKIRKETENGIAEGF
jgi:hypothetical protein